MVLNLTCYEIVWQVKVQGQKHGENCSIAIKIAHTSVDVHMYAHSYTHIRVVNRALGRKKEETEDY